MFFMEGEIMSSVNWKKNHNGEIYPMLEHSSRHDGKTVKYRNEYINQELSYQNEIIVQHNETKCSLQHLKSA